MSDYRLRISVRNARLLRAIEAAGYRPGQEFARAVGISYSGSLLPYLNLTRSPLTNDGLLRECAWSLCDFLGASPSDLWSDAQLEPLTHNHSSVDVSEDTVRYLGHEKADNDPLRIATNAQACRVLKEHIDSLTPQQADVIRRRFFSDLSLREVGEQIGVTRERVRQIEAKALARLRWRAKRSSDLADAAEAIHHE